MKQKAKPKSLNFIVSCGVYPFDIMLSLGETDEQLKKALKKHNLPWDDDISKANLKKGIFYIHTQGTSLIRMHNIPLNVTDHGFLQHEILHAVLNILDRVGVKLQLDVSEEAYTYLLQHLTVEIYRKIW